MSNSSILSALSLNKNNLATAEYDEKRIKGDNYYLIPALVAIGIIYAVFGSPNMQMRAMTARNRNNKSMYGWVDLAIKLSIIYGICYISTQDVLSSLIVTLVFGLFLLYSVKLMIIERSRESFDEELGSYGAPISNADTKLGEIPLPEIPPIELSDDSEEKSIEEAMNVQSVEEDSDISDEYGLKYECPTDRQVASGLVPDTLAGAESLAVADGMGVTVTSEQNNNSMNNEIHNVAGFDLDADNSYSMIEGFDSVIYQYEYDSNPEVASENISDQNNLSPSVLEAIDQSLREISSEVEQEKRAEGEEISISAQHNDEARKAVHFVALKMSQDGKVVTHHDLKMICRFVYGQMFKCKGMLRSVVRDSGYEASNDEASNNDEILNDEAFNNENIEGFHGNLPDYETYAPYYEKPTKIQPVIEYVPGYVPPSAEEEIGNLDYFEDDSNDSDGFDE